jgi:exonuclease VII small subunit
LNFVHDANFVNRKININVDLIPTSNSYDLGSATNRFSQIHGTTINASFQVASNQIAPYTGSEVNLNGDFLPINPLGGGSGTRKLGNGQNLWSEVFAADGTINTSDRNMKKDITPIKGGLEFVRKLQPVSYVWKNRGKRTHTGFIAQEVLECNPLKDQWGGYIDTGHGLGLRYTEFISINTQAIKELDSKVSRLVSGLSSDTKVDLNYHTDSSELVERIEALENKKPLETVVEEYDDSELKQQIKQLQIDNRKQEDCISQLISENMNLTEKLNMLMERFDKFVNDKPNVKLEVVDDSDILLSETGDNDHMELVEQRLHTLETKVTKLSNKQTKLVTAINKLKK